MTDTFTPQKRSEIMSRIRGKNTKPERTVRSILHRMGFRFSLHKRNLPGIPDICLAKYKTVIFVNGCFWHRHKDCVKGLCTPQTNEDLWQAKFEKTVKRDVRNYTDLRDMGWNVMVIWECELKDISSLMDRLNRELRLKN